MPLAGPPATRDDSGTTARDNTPVVPDDSPAIVPATSTTPPLSDLASDCQPSTGSNPQVGPFLALEAIRMPFRVQATAGSLSLEELSSRILLRPSVPGSRTPVLPGRPWPGDLS